ncbi:hematopoietic prostaglandin D synthase-like isoform X2 [Glandiceps talaboti]
MPQYRLTYYNCRSIAETARLIFAVAGVDYEDVRFEIRGEQWAKEKKTDRLAGKDNLENARIDMITGAIEDLVKGMLQFHYYEKDEDKKKVLESEYKANKEPVILKGLEKLLKDNNGGDGYFVGDDLTWADLDFLAGIEDNISRDTMVLDNYPKLRALRERVMALPKIAAWLEKRPQTYV